MPDTSEIRFTAKQISMIRERFQEYSSGGLMSRQAFQRSMGLLGVGQAEHLSNRMFEVMTGGRECTWESFVCFLDVINNGSLGEKARLSFKYLNRRDDGFLSLDDIEAVISEVCFLWHFLTGEKISASQGIEVLCLRLGITQQHSISYEEYLGIYGDSFEWYDFFNSRPIEQQDRLNTSIRHANNEFKVDQVEEYLKLVHGEISSLLFSLQSREEEKSEQLEMSEREPTQRGPVAISTKEFQPRGEKQYNFRETLPYLSCQELESELFKEGDDSYEMVGSRLKQLSELAGRLFEGRQVPASARGGGRHSFSLQSEQRAVLNMTRPVEGLRSVVYLGHENWNLMLNMMLGIRKSLKSHYYRSGGHVTFSEEDIHCKYYHELLYKVNLKSVKEMSYVFVDYAPKVFHFIRKVFGIDNTQFLRSIGLQNLVGNLLMGNLSTLSDRTSEGKSGSFMYYTSDGKIIVKSCTREEYLQLRGLLQAYADYVRRSPDTYLMRIYGLYKMKNKHLGKELYFMVLGNVFESEYEIDQRYDIKGATHNRRTLTEGEDIQSHLLFNKHIALKDLDLIDNHQRTFDIIKSQRQEIYEQILSDAKFLKDNNLIEYSLLIGVHKGGLKGRQRSVWQRNRLSRAVVSQNGKELYFFGLIDLLSDYSGRKVLENKFFGLLNMDISCRDPEEYYTRFKNFISKYVFSS